MRVNPFILFRFQRNKIFLPCAPIVRLREERDEERDRLINTMYNKINAIHRNQPGTGKYVTHINLLITEVSISYNRAVRVNPIILFRFQRNKIFLPCAPIVRLREERDEERDRLINTMYNKINAIHRNQPGTGKYVTDINLLITEVSISYKYSLITGI